MLCMRTQVWAINLSSMRVDSISMTQGLLMLLATI
ncbi:hypothetical protein BAZSYMA_ACONTIG00457_5 [Bathymodiolus azoricus thioautotrophic gill symbiont]|uniref:Uncharacterized protein n=1 Tax=Bathymodiolus azoricus thioautotrophic gill symbiont TaxID=235205 RepID=A0A1H6MA16_9GAMM|nr:hypothetical protein BAZSYMA_ACONTIG00457_5 [Bathymodiolus azoricus thioautotrophic gill symbiont]